MPCKPTLAEKTVATGFVSAINVSFSNDSFVWVRFQSATTIAVRIVPVAYLATPLKGYARAVGRAIERGIELQFPGLDDAQDGIGRHQDESLGSSGRVSSEDIDVQEREEEDVELRRDILLGRVDLIDLQEILDRHRRPIACQLQVLDVHRLASRIGGDSDSKRIRNLITPGLRFRAPYRQSRPVRLRGS